MLAMRFIPVQLVQMLTQKETAQCLHIMRKVEPAIGHSLGLFRLNEVSMTGVIAAGVDGSSGLAYHMKTNLEFPLHTSAPGKALLAYTPPDEREKFYARMEFRPYTPNTITRKEDFEAELKCVLKKGYAMDLSEEREGCHCIAVPIFNSFHTVVSALWASAPSSQFPIRTFSAVAASLKKGSQEITRRLYGADRTSNHEYTGQIIDQAKKLIAGNLTEPFEVQKLAENLYVSYSWFRKSFKEQTGCSPTGYHLKLRLEKARELLKETELPIRKISEELGFKNQNHFSALFKRKTGQSPIACRACS